MRWLLVGSTSVKPIMEQRVDMPGEEDLLRIEAQRNWIRNHFSDDARQRRCNRTRWNCARGLRNKPPRCSARQVCTSQC